MRIGALLFLDFLTIEDSPRGFVSLLERNQSGIDVHAIGKRYSDIGGYITKPICLARPCRHLSHE